MKGVSGCLTDSAAWQEVAPYSLRRHPRRVSERVTHVRWSCWAALLFPVFGLFSSGIQNVDVKSISVDVFETVGEAGEAEGNKGWSGHAGSFDQFDLSVKRFNDSTFIFLRPKTNHDLYPYPPCPSYPRRRVSRVSNTGSPHCPADTSPTGAKRPAGTITPRVAVGIIVS